ncbi:acyltransferase domain-containing protein [Streptomyces sp. M19]
MALGELVAGCEAEGVRARVIPVDYASHSVRVEEIRERLLEELAPVCPRVGSVPVYSSVTGGSWMLVRLMRRIGCVICGRRFGSRRPPVR